MNMKSMITRSSHYSVNHPSVQQVLLHSLHKEMDHAVDEGNISKKKVAHEWMNNPVYFLPGKCHTRARTQNQYEENVASPIILEYDTV